MADETYRALAGLVSAGELVVLSGAGLSTESGIPDYRGEGAAQRPRTPMTFQTFTGDRVARRRYWARSHLGWRTIARAEPNAGHLGVAELQRRGLISGIITQNVDGLHQAAGARHVVELHGNLAQVVCLGCGARTTRERLHARLAAANPGFAASVSAIAPDGDADIDERDLAGFTVVACEECDGVLKPDVVFFGETVEPERVRTCFDLVERARGVLVLGSSLTVLSGRRFVVHAVKRGIPVGIVNRGPTRADDRVNWRLDAPLGVALPRLLGELGLTASAAA